MIDCMEKLKKRSEQNKSDCWDLTVMIKNQDEYEKKIQEVKELNQEIVRMKGKILDNKENLKNFLKVSEKETRIADLLYIYVYLKFDEDTSNSKSLSHKLEIEQLLNTVSDNESFINSEFMQKDLKDILPWLESDEFLKSYKLSFERLYRKKKHILSEKEEKIITKALNAFGTPDEAFTALDTTNAFFGKVILDDGTKEVLTQYNWQMFLENPSQSNRRRAFHTFYKFYEQHKNTFAAFLKGNYQELEFLRDIRGYESALSMALDRICVTPKVYDNLISNVHKYININIEYQKLKAKVLNNKEYHLYDTYVPIVELEQKKITKDEAIKIVKEALKPLKEEYLKKFQSIFDSHAVDFYSNEYKHNGAYHWGCYDSPSYVLLNFNGTYDAVSTLAHELGHAVHSTYSKENNSFEYYSYDTFVAEIASTVNETLLSFYFLKNAHTKKEKMYIFFLFLDKVKDNIYS